MSGDGVMASSSVAKSSATQSGPPYFCPTCQTSYSRLEYLRRHERRHADERPFVCDCGKGFSRSDVLSRHKRQCAVVLNGGEGGANGSVGDLSSASNKTNGGKRASASGPIRRKSSTSRGGGGGAKVAGRKSRGSGARNNSLNQSADDDDDDDDGNQSNSPPFARPGQHQQQAPHHMHPSGIPSSVTTSTNSFPFPPQPGVQQLSSAAPPPLLPPAPYGSADGGMMVGQAGNGGAGGGGGASAMGGMAGGAGIGQSNNSPFGGVMQSHHLSAFNNLVNQQHHYPSSPESNGTVSQHGSPRFSARDMARHGSNGSRTFSLRKGGSFDHIGPRNASGAIPGTTPNQYAPEFWDALDPAAKNASSMAGSDYMSAGAAVGLGDASNGGSSGIVGGLNGGGGGVTTPRGGEPHRFAVSTGPLSPFSTIALTSTMSPYLSAFSNARDTPFVASPSRGMIPGTPGSSLNVFDWTMRPPSKPASSTMAKRDSLSHGSTATSTAAGAGSTAAGGSTSTSASTNTSPSSSAQNKRKREDEEGSRKSPKMEYYADSQSLDDDHRSAAELLDSLRTAGLRPAVHTPGATDASTIASSTTSVAAPVTTSVGATSNALPAVSSLAEDDASALAAVSAAADAEAISAVSEAPVTPSAPVVSEREGVFADPLREHQKDEKTAAPATTTTTKATKAEENSAVPPRSTESPPPRNLTLSQLPLSSAPTSAAGLAQSSWEALMNGNGWTNGANATSTSTATNSINPLADRAKHAPTNVNNASAPSKITAERAAQAVGDEARGQSS